MKRIRVIVASTIILAATVLVLIELLRSTKHVSLATVTVDYSGATQIPKSVSITPTVNSSEWSGMQITTRPHKTGATVLYVTVTQTRWGSLMGLINADSAEQPSLSIVSSVQVKHIEEHSVFQIDVTTGTRYMYTNGLNGKMSYTQVELE